MCKLLKTFFMNIFKPKVKDELPVIGKPSKSTREKELTRLASAVRLRESSNDYTVVNEFGYMGAYQFGMGRLCDLGLTAREGDKFVWVNPYSEELFLKSPDIQDAMFMVHIMDLAEKCEYYLKFTEDITLSGLAMGAHLGGMGGVEKYFKRGHDTKDAYGTSIGDYMKEFSGYNIE